MRLDFIFSYYDFRYHATFQFPPKGNPTAWYRLAGALRPLLAGEAHPGRGLSAAGSIQPLETAPSRRIGALKVEGIPQ